MEQATHQLQIDALQEIELPNDPAPQQTSSHNQIKGKNISKEYKV